MGLPRLVRCSCAKRRGKHEANPRSGLAAMSYDLHEELSDKFGGAEKWGYRTVETLVRRARYLLPDWIERRS